MPQRLVIVACLTLVAAAAWSTGGQPPSVILPTPTSTQQSGNFAFLGAGSCAAQACHNSDGLGPRGREYAVALQRDFTSHPPRVVDKHARAYAALFEEPAQRMVRKWKGLDATEAVHPEREALCLRCHVHPQYDAPAAFDAQGNRRLHLEDGVSCEGCHGPAERWLAAHFRPGWTESSRLAAGMTDTRSILGRVGVCLDCHVGSPHAQVDHDLIAAGHPWLHFDMGEYHARCHKHWDSAKDINPDIHPRGRRDFEAQLREVGRVAVAQAALDLVALRARDAQRPWPEFADYDCRSCHHDLKAPSAWPTRPGEAGNPDLNHWYGEILAASKSKPEVADLRSAFRSWRPDRKAVEGKARSLARDLGARLATWKLEQAKP